MIRIALMIFLSVALYSCGNSIKKVPDIEFKTMAEVDEYLAEMRAGWIIYNQQDLEPEPYRDSIATYFANCTCDCISKVDFEFLDVTREQLNNVNRGRMHDDNIYGAEYRLYSQCFVMLDELLILGRGVPYVAHSRIPNLIEKFCGEDAEKLKEVYERHRFKLFGLR